MEKDAFIFIGRSGCGKGTQKDLVVKKLESLGMPNLSLYTGDSLREFMNGQTSVSKKIKEVVSNGGLVPSFVASTMWSKILMEKYQDTQSLILDGSPRTLNEAYELETALQFLGFINPEVIYINVSNNWSKERLMARGRKDDSEESINTRLGWFDTSVLDVVNYYRNKSYYHFHEINGEQTIDAVAADVMKALPYLNKAQSNPNSVGRSYDYVSSADSVNLQTNNEHTNQNPVRN